MVVKNGRVIMVILLEMYDQTVRNKSMEKMAAYLC